MNLSSQYPIFAHLPRLSDEAASTMLDFLNDLLYQFETEYGSAIRRYRDITHSAPPHINQLDLFNNLDDPPF